MDVGAGCACFDLGERVEVVPFALRRGRLIGRGCVRGVEALVLEVVLAFGVASPADRAVLDVGVNGPG